jgi:hypothetical protein
VFEAVLLAEARAARDVLSDAERANVDRILHLLELNPWADGVTKFTVVLSGVGVGIYDDD